MKLIFLIIFELVALYPFQASDAYFKYGQMFVRYELLRVSFEKLYLSLS